jgi:hypothetical protein
VVTGEVVQAEILHQYREEADQSRDLREVVVAVFQEVCKQAVVEVEVAVLPQETQIKPHKEVLEEQEL